MINTVAIQVDGSFLVNGEMCVPDDMTNRHRRKVQVWIDTGHTPDPYDPSGGTGMVAYKAGKILDAKMQMDSLLKRHADWATTRQVRTNGSKPVPAAIATYYTAMDADIARIESEIKALTTVQEVADHALTWTAPPARS